MADRRSGPPLFDLMRERERKPNAPEPRPQPKKQPAQTPPAEAKPEQKVATNPASPLQPTTHSPGRQVAWDTSGGVSRAERSAAAMLDEDPQSDSGIHMSTPRFYTIIAVALVLIVGAWAGGYQLGRSDGRAEMSRFVPDQPVVSPQQQAESAPPPVVTDQPTASRPIQPQPSRPTQASNRPAVASLGPDAVLTPDGAASDPRVGGMNYLALATLPSDQARDAISFMDANGVPVIGVPQLDSRGGSANNPSRYTLYSLGLAIPGNRWSAMSSQRRDHQQMVATLGARWQRDHRGGSDFSQTNWEKFNP